MAERFTPLLAFTDRNPVSKRLRKEPSPSINEEAVTDAETLRLLQVEALHETVDRTRTAIGSATLMADLLHPPTPEDYKKVKAKQESVKALLANPELTQELTQFLASFNRQESAIYVFLYGLRYPYALEPPYPDFKKARKGIISVPKDKKDISTTPKDSHIQKLLTDIDGLEQSDAYQTIKVPFRTRHGITTKKDSQFPLRWRFRPGRLSGQLPFWSAIAYGSMQAPVSPDTKTTLTSSILFSLFYMALIKPSLDYSTAIVPLGKKAVADEQFMRSLVAIGELDELVSCANLYQEAQQQGLPVTFPTLSDDTHHSFAATELHNPVLAIANPQTSVPNDIYLPNGQITCVTGPNSGGKTTFAKTLLQSQLLGQTGFPVFATDARITMADKILYQAPSFDSLTDEEGRFGTEAKRTRDIFFGVTRRSIAVLDELAEGTTIKEKMDHSRRLIRDFGDIGQNLVLITHNHELVEELHRDGIATPLRVSFDGENPTHKIVSGISTESHANRVLGKIGFGPEERDVFLREHGYRE